ncbi:MAG: superoxide dismutase [Patescibacteria group bacterium]
MPDFTLPALPFEYGALAPQISEEQLRLHHSKHHAAYIANANALMEKIAAARAANADVDPKLWRALSFNVAGHKLHSLFWENLAPQSGDEPTGELKKLLEANFGSFANFQKEFTASATTIEGSGWAALLYAPENQKLFLAPIENHNKIYFPEAKILLVLDVWEHAFYLDYKNEKAKFVAAFWEIVNWSAVAARLAK